MTQQHSRVSSEQHVVSQHPQQLKVSFNNNETPYLTIFRILQLAQSDPLEALLVAQETGHEDLFIFILEIAGKQLGSEVISWIQQHKNHQQFEDFVDSYLRGVASVDPQLALRDIDLLLSRTMKSSTIMSIIDVWGSTDVMATFEWLKQQPETQSSLKMYLNTLYYYIEQSPNEAANLIALLPITESTGYLVTSVVYQLVEKNLQSAVDWLDKIPAEHRASGVYIISRKMAEQDPETALTFLYNQKNANELNQDYFNSGVAEIANVAPEMMLARLDSFEPDMQKDIVINASYAFSEQSDAAFAQMFNHLSDDNKDIAYSQRAAQMSNRDAKQAFSLAQQIHDSTTQLESVIQTVNLWSRYDKNAALEAIDQSNWLNEQQKSYIKIQASLQFTSSSMIYP